MLYIEIITNMVRFISLFKYVLLSIGLPSSHLFPAQKLRSNTEEALFGIPGAITETKNDLRVKPIVESNIGFLLKVERYSCD